MTDILERLKTRFDPRIVQPDEMARDAHAEIERLRALLHRIADTPDEDNEWDGRDKFRDNRRTAAAALNNIDEQQPRPK